jgi:ribosomal protein S18 acetylase RimI-like enzyme
MSFVVEPLQESDLVEWAKVHFQAFYPRISMLWHSPPTEKGFELLGETRRPILSNPEAHVFKCVDTSNGKIVGVAHWKVYEKQRTPEEVEATLGEDQKDPVANAEIHINLDARGIFMKNIWTSRREVLGGQPNVMLGVLTVLPEYQRRGVGKLLVQWGVDEADR